MFAVPRFDKSGCSDPSHRRRCHGRDRECDPLHFATAPIQDARPPAKYRSGELLAIFRHRQAADHFEAKASQERCLELFQMRAEMGKRKALLRDLGDFLVSAKIKLDDTIVLTQDSREKYKKAIYIFN